MRLRFFLFLELTRVGVVVARCRQVYIDSFCRGGVGY